MKAFIVRVLLIFIGAILLIQLWIFSSLVWWRTHEVDTTMFMRIDYWSDPSEPIVHEWLDYDDISDNFKHAILAGEDAKFIHHHGFDWDGIRFALERNNEQGGSLLVVLPYLNNLQRTCSYIISVHLFVKVKKL